MNDPLLYANRNLHAQATTFEIGDLVLVENKKILDGISKKLLPLRNGIYQVTKCITSVTYSIQHIQTGETLLRHRNLLIPYIPKALSIPALDHAYKENKKQFKTHILPQIPIADISFSSPSTTEPSNSQPSTSHQLPTPHQHQHTHNTRSKKQPSITYNNLSQPLPTPSIPNIQHTPQLITPSNPYNLRRHSRTIHPHTNNHDTLHNNPHHWIHQIDTSQWPRNTHHRTKLQYYADAYDCPCTTTQAHSSCPHY